MPSPATEPSLEELVRFCHPRKILAGTRLPVPGALDDTVLAALYGTTTEQVRALAARMRADARKTAERLVAHPALATLPDRARLLAVGDSITDDLGSWAEMIAAALALARPSAGIQVANAGLSGDTTADAVARSGRLPLADVAVVLLGTNDARRHGRDGVPVLVADDETARNVAVLERLLRRRCGRVLWVTPPPVAEDRVQADAGLREADLVWRLSDVRRKAAVVRARAAPMVDLWPRFGDPPDGALLRPDGVHPSVEGQLAIAAAVLDGL